jgi:hypothetical protein
MDFRSGFLPSPTLTRRTLGISALALVGGLARAQRPYPAQRINMLIPFPPGTGNDVVGRVVGQKLSDTLGQPVVIDNRSGAFGNIAMETTRRADPDGYTVAVASTSFSVNRWTMLSATYSLADFTPIAMVASQPYSLMVSKSVPAKNVHDLMDLLKQDPSKYTGGQGSGTGYFLLSLLNKELGKGVATAAYKGTTDAVIDLLAGRIDLLFAPISFRLETRGLVARCPDIYGVRISGAGYRHLVCHAWPEGHGKHRCRHIERCGSQGRAGAGRDHDPGQERDLARLSDAFRTRQLSQGRFGPLERYREGFRLRPAIGSLRSLIPLQEGARAVDGARLQLRWLLPGVHRDLGIRAERGDIDRSDQRMCGNVVRQYQHRRLA